MTKKYILVILLVVTCFVLHVSGANKANALLDDPGPTASSGRVYASTSVLSSGEWYKVAVAQSGICRISYSMLQGMGVNMSEIDPRNIRLYGNGGGMLPEGNSAWRPDDLLENAILVTGESDGKFDVSDYILFYASGPVTWSYNSLQHLWEHRENTYSDSAYYFISVGGTTKGKRISTIPFSLASPTNEVTSFDYRTYHEKDAENLIKSGRSWYGETFDILNEYDFPFEIPGLLPETNVTVKTITAARSTVSSSFTITSGYNSWQVTHTPISTYYNSPYASGAVVYKSFMSESSPLTLNIKYNKTTTTGIGWLDCIDLTARSSLLFNRGQMTFRDLESVGVGNVSRFTLQAAAGKAAIWDITNPLQPSLVETGTSGNDLVFTLLTDTLREFIAFDVTDLIVPRFVSKVANQNLHGINGVDMVIVAHPLFFSQAVRLATYHTNTDDLNTLVLTPETIYNEFSSGSPDVIAIRDFMKMLYDRGGASGKPRLLLLFGDGSYDNKNRLPGNTNFIPSWQTTESFDPVRSGVSDDYFGLLDDDEGLSFSDNVDIGIGRLPVKTEEEAASMVDKIITYSAKSSDVMGDWRNIIAFVADDEDGNEHIIQADNMAEFLGNNFGSFNLDKIYLDAYFEQSTPAGARYPDVNKAITQRVEKGCLILNYTGHGGETGWAHEQVLEVQDINSWSNDLNLPVFVTATCEFSRFDDPGRTSAGELVLLNPHGGGIALFTTTRPTYGSPNFELNKSLYKFALSTTNGRRPMLGDIMKDAKRESGSNENGKKFILLGDPAVTIAFPELNVETTSVNGHDISSDADTLKAYAEVTVTGRITDATGTLVSDFNGMVFPTVFDKAVEQTTLGNDGGIPFTFTLQKSVLYKGKVRVDSGQFVFSFIVPKDIAYRYGYGKLSYYATDGQRDANGFYDNLVVGGSNGNQHSDVAGPDITLYMNDESFIDGGITDENPWLIAKVFDDSGINTIGSGIGHDITAVLDGKTDNPYVLNDFYEADLNTFKSGIIHFPLSMLDAGEHTLTVKVWDIYNNSAESVIHFTVHNSSDLIVQNPRNYPNPCYDFTNIVFDHNQQGTELKVRADIYSVTGNLICTLEQNNLEQGVSSTPIKWDGVTSYGTKVGSGIYLYTLTVTSSTGAKSRCNGKILVAR